MLGLRIEGFNGAAAVQPRKEQPKQGVAGRFVASMGPRLFSRGRFAVRVVKLDSQLASMGPRLFSRGRDPEEY